MVKLNVDASVKGPMDRAAIGGVLQDDKGKRIWGFALAIGHELMDADGAELKALKSVWKRLGSKE